MGGSLVLFIKTWKHGPESISKIFRGCSTHHSPRIPEPQKQNNFKVPFSTFQCSTPWLPKLCLKLTQVQLRSPLLRAVNLGSTYTVPSPPGAKCMSYGDLVLSTQISKWCPGEPQGSSTELLQRQRPHRKHLLGQCLVGPWRQKPTSLYPGGCFQVKGSHTDRAAGMKLQPGRVTGKRLQPVRAATWTVPRKTRRQSLGGPIPTPVYLKGRISSQRRSFWSQEI